MGPRAPDQSYMDFVLDHLPWLSGSLGTVFLDLTVSSKMSIWASLKYCNRFCCSAYAWITIELSTTMIQKTSKMKIDPFSRVKGVAVDFIVDWTFTSNHLRSENFPLHSISSIYCFYTYRFLTYESETTAKARIFQDSQYYTEYRSKLHLAQM